MKLHNRILFHCLGCGRVVHAEPTAEIPNCCGKQMTKAAAETVANGDEATPPCAEREAGDHPPGEQIRIVPR